MRKPWFSVRFAGPATLSDRLNLLPCASCGAAGPHSAFPARADGFIALCEACQVAAVESVTHTVGA